MRTKTLTLVLGTIWLLAVHATAKEGTVPIALKIRHNGRVQPSPSQVTFEFGGRIQEVQVRNGSLELPPELRAAKSVTISFKLKKERIRIPNLTLSKFTGGNWTVLLEDKSYGDDYKWAVPKGANVRSSCIWLFEPSDAEGTSAFVEGCRTEAR